MKKTKQLEFIPTPKKFFGGSLLHGRRRRMRPLSSKEALHIVMRSSWAYGANSFLNRRNRKPIERLIGGIARKYEVKIYSQAIVGNHIHLVVKFPNRRNYSTFIRVLSGKIAEQVMDFRSFKDFKNSLKQRWGDPPNATKEIQGKGQAFWQFRPFTRIISWGRAFKAACAYVIQNQKEALGFIAYKDRGRSPYKVQANANRRFSSA